MARSHHYEVDVTWRGDTGGGYRGYERAHEVGGEGKPAIPGSADPAFRGDPQRWNPEELLVVSLSQCHMLWYLALCAQAGIAVTSYVDHATGTMVESSDGSGRFDSVVLHPAVVLADPTRADEATALHVRAHEMCFIANSVNFPVRHEPTIRGEDPQTA